VAQWVEHTPLKLAEPVKQVSVFLESTSRVYEFIWKELSL